MADLPVALPSELAQRLAAALDVEGKIPRALDALGPVRDRDVVLVDGDGGIREAQLTELGARVRVVDSSGTDGYGLPDASADVVVAFWSAFRGVNPADLAEAERVLRPGGRLLVVHDYGRDDVSSLHAGDGVRPEYGEWSRRNGPFLSHGFKVRVVHCWWTFDSLAAVQDFLFDAFGEPGRRYAADLKRPRLSYNVAIYHRTVGEESAAAGEPGG